MSTLTLESEPPETMNEEEMITVKAAAERKGCKVATVYKAIKDGRLPHTLILDRVALRPSDVDAWQPDKWGGQRENQKGRPKKQDAAE